MSTQALQRWVVLAVSVIILTACKPLGDDSAGACSAQITGDGTAANQQALSKTNSVAQPIILPVTGNLSSIQLKLQSISATSTHISGLLTVSIQHDLSLVTGTVSRPSGTALTGATGTLDMSTVSLSNAVLYPIGFSSTVQLTAGEVYWVVVTVPYDAGGDHIGWQGTSSLVYSKLPAATNDSVHGWVASAPSQNMIVLAGCQ